MEAEAEAEGALRGFAGALRGFAGGDTGHLRAARAGD